MTVMHKITRTHPSLARELEGEGGVVSGVIPV